MRTTVNGDGKIMANVTPVQSCWVLIVPNNGQVAVTLQLDDGSGTAVPVKVGSISDAASLGELVATRHCGYDADSGKVVAYFKAAAPASGQTFELMSPPQPPPRQSLARGRSSKTKNKR